MKFTFPNISIFNNMSDDMGIDLGTANTLVHCKDKGIIIREPSVVAVEKDTNEVLAIGAEAKRMIGRTPGNIIAIRPMKDGVIADYEITQSMLKYFIKQAMGNRTFVRPRILVGVPSGVTEVEKRAVVDATIEAGAREAYLIEEPMAAAIGAGLPVQEARYRRRYLRGCRNFSGRHCCQQERTLRRRCYRQCYCTLYPQSL